MHSLFPAFMLVALIAFVAIVAVQPLYSRLSGGITNE